MAELQRWHELVCPCGNATFLQLVTLRHHTQGGSTEAPAGKRCAACGKDADIGAMWKAIQLDRAKLQLQELQRQIYGEDSPPVEATATSMPTNSGPNSISSAAS